MKKACVLVCLFLILTIFGCESVRPSGTSIATIIGERARVEEYVRDIKKRFKDSDQQYVEAKTLYVKAYGSYKGWVGSLTQAIQTGAKANLYESEDYRAIAKQAMADGAAFIAYVEKVTVPSKTVLETLTALTTVGLDAWKQYKAIDDLARKTEAEALQKKLDWSRWDDIK